MKHFRSAGFTLIEVLIAVVVLSISLGAALEALSGFANTQARLQERYCAHLVAWEDALFFYADDDEVVQAGFSEQCGVDWKVDTEEFEIHAAEDCEEDEYCLPIRIVAQTLKVYSPANDDIDARPSARLQVVKLRLD